MATTTHLSKNSTTVTHLNKPTGETVTWDEAVFTWEDSYPSTWNNIRTPFNRPSKNSTTTTHLSKN